MLSGFVLAHSYYDGKTSYSAYARNRFARIYPIYVLAAVVTLPWIGLSFADSTSWQSCTRFVGLIVVDVFMLQAWIPAMFHYWNNGASWSMSVEAFCYALLPLLLVRLKTKTTRYVTAIALGLYVTICVCGFLTIMMPEWWLRAVYSMPLFRLPEFIIGVCCYLFFKRGYLTFLGNTSVQITIFIVAILYLGLIGNFANGYVVHHWFIIPSISLLLVSLAQEKGALHLALSHPIAVWLGRISYCFYSFQPFIWRSLTSHHDDIVTHFPMFADNRILGFTAFCTLFVVSALAYHFIENPMRDLIRQRQLSSAHPYQQS